MFAWVYLRFNQNHEKVHNPWFGWWEKQRIINEIISPKAIVSVQAEIRDPQYLYLLVDNVVQYDPKKVSVSETTLKNNIRQAVINYNSTDLNKFGATFVLSELQDDIEHTNMNGIIGAETLLRVQRRFTPNLNQSTSYTIKYNVPIHRGTITNRLTSTEFGVYDVTGTVRNAIFEETPQSYTGISKI
mgnify:CR=1 FL=1